MLLQPKKFKYSKTHKGSATRYCQLKASKSNNRLVFGPVGLMALSSGYMTPQQVESLRKALTLYSKKPFKMWVRLKPYIARTQKASESRMGKGRGKIVQWVLFVRRGQVLFEFDTKLVHIFFNKTRLKPITSRLPVKLHFVSNKDLVSY